MEFSYFTSNRELLFDVAGMAGVLIYVGSYAALQFGRLDGNSIQYCLCNGSAAALVLISLIHDFNLASALIQIVWISVSLFGLYRYVRRRRHPVDTEVIHSASLLRHDTRRLSRRRYGDGRPLATR